MLILYPATWYSKVSSFICFLFVCFLCRDPPLGILLGLLVTHSLSFLSSENILIFLTHSWKIFILDIDSWLIALSSALEKCDTTSLWPLWFLISESFLSLEFFSLNISCFSNPDFNIFFCLFFQSLAMPWLVEHYFGIVKFVVHSASWIFCQI